MGIRIGLDKAIDSWIVGCTLQLHRASEGDLEAGADARIISLRQEFILGIPWNE